MPIIDDLISQIESHPVKEIAMGVLCTAVQSGSCGLSSTLRYGIDPHSPIREAGKLKVKSSIELARYLYSDNLLEASIGMAALNSALPKEEFKFTTINATNIILKKGAGKCVAVIGHFPFVEQRGNPFKKLMVFEKFPRDGDLREEDIPIYLPEADVVAITATSIPNHSFKNIMEHVSPYSYRIMLGPTTPISTVLFDYGIDTLGGSIVRDELSVISQVKEGISFKNMVGIEQVILSKENDIRNTR